MLKKNRVQKTDRQRRGSRDSGRRRHRRTRRQKQAFKQTGRQTHTQTADPKLSPEQNQSRIDATRTLRSKPRGQEAHYFHHFLLSPFTNSLLALHSSPLLRVSLSYVEKKAFGPDLFPVRPDFMVSEARCQERSGAERDSKTHAVKTQQDKEMKKAVC